jgi:vacuolar-type H+-ATPase subunit F/Vma7
MRLVAMGGAALMQGFALLGAETYGDATEEDVERVLAELLRGQDQALVFVENTLVARGGRYLERVRREGGRVIVSEVPPLDSPESYRPPVEALVARVVGAAALEERT